MLLLLLVPRGFSGKAALSEVLAELPSMDRTAGSAFLHLQQLHLPLPVEAADALCDNVTGTVDRIDPNDPDESADCMAK